MKQIHAAWLKIYRRFSGHKPNIYLLYPVNTQEREERKTWVRGHGEEARTDAHRYY